MAALRWHAGSFRGGMTSQPDSHPLNLGPDRIFGPLDQDLAHRAAQLPPAKALSPARDASPSYCLWPSKLVERP
jgi:hypothetical protein